MRNNLKDLYVSYPFMPVASSPSWFKSVKFMRVMVTLPASQPVTSELNGDYIVATLKTLSASQATVHVVCNTYGFEEDVTVPVFTNSVPTGNSYLYTDSALPTLSNLSYRIHPSCLVFQQTAPTLTMEVHSGNENPVVQLEYSNGVVSQWIRADKIEELQIDRVLWLANGHNVDVSGSSDTVIFTGAAGAGTGIWDIVPYSTESTTFDGYRGKALRSINGKTGNVIIQGDLSVAVEKAETPAAALKVTPIYT